MRAFILAGLLVACGGVADGGDYFDSEVPEYVGELQQAMSVIPTALWSYGTRVISGSNTRNSCDRTTTTQQCNILRGGTVNTQNAAVNVFMDPLVIESSVVSFITNELAAQLAVGAGSHYTFTFTPGASSPTNCPNAGGSCSNLKIMSTTKSVTSGSLDVTKFADLTWSDCSTLTEGFVGNPQSIPGTFHFCRTATISIDSQAIRNRGGNPAGGACNSTCQTKNVQQVISKYMLAAMGIGRTSDEEGRTSDSLNVNAQSSVILTARQKCRALSFGSSSSVVPPSDTSFGIASGSCGS